jgi:hypothetical protein
LKLVVQNGSDNCLSRNEMQLIFPHILEASDDFISEVCLYQQSNDQPKIIFYKKSRLLGIFWKPSTNIDEGKIELVNELFISIEAIKTFEKLPEKLSNSLKSQFLLSSEKYRTNAISLILGKDK